MQIISPDFRLVKMAKTYTVTLTDAEDKALGIVSNNQQEWINNAVHNRCRIAIDEIFLLEAERIASVGGTLSGTKDDVVLAYIPPSILPAQAP